MKSANLSISIRLSLAVLALAVLGGCSGSQSGGGSAPSTTTATGPTVVTINGEAVPQNLLDAFAIARGIDLSNPQQRERALKQLTDFVLLEQLAKKEGYTNDPEFVAAVDLGRLQTISSAATRQLQKTLVVDDAAVRAEYEQQAAKGAGVAYDFSQIVYADEAAAKKAAAAINAKPFDATLDSYRKDARMARNFNKVRSTQLPPPLATALTALKPGETTKTPVQLPQGWAVLHLTTANEIPQPPFEQVKEGIKRMLGKRLGDERITKLRESATIVLADPPPPPAAAATKPAAGPRSVPMTPTPAPAAATPAPAVPAAQPAKD